MKCSKMIEFLAALRDAHGDPEVYIIDGLESPAGIFSISAAWRNARSTKLSSGHGVTDRVVGVIRATRYLESER